MSDSLWTHGLYSPWNSPGQNTGVSSLPLLQGNLPNPGIEPRSPALTGGFFTTHATWEACKFMLTWKKDDIKTLICEYSKIITLVAQPVKSPPAMWETWVPSLGWEDPWRRERLPTPVFWPREFHGLHNSLGYNESDITEQLSLSISHVLAFLKVSGLRLFWQSFDFIKVDSKVLEGF